MLLADFLDGVIKLLNAGFHLVEQSHQGTYFENMGFQQRNIANGRNRRANLFGPGRCFSGAAPMTAKECFQESFVAPAAVGQRLSRSRTGAAPMSSNQVNTWGK